MMTDRKHNVHVARIDSKVSKGELGNLFRPFGKVSNLFIATQPPNAPFTYGFVHFENEDDAALAIDKLNGIFFHGQRLVVEPGCERDDSNKTFLQSDHNIRRRRNFRSSEPRHPGAYQSKPRSELDDQSVWNTDVNGRNEHLSRLTNIYAEVIQSPLLPDGGAALPDLLLWLTVIDRLPLTVGPVYNQKKPQCFLDLDVLDELSERFWKERKEKTSCGI